MKRYLVFGFEAYYPSGGWDDLLEDFDNLEDARTSITSKNACKHKNIRFCKREFNQIVDLETGEEIS